MERSVPATVVPGHRVASGTGDDRRFPAGTIRPQLPHLRAVPGFLRHLGGEPFAGTVNLRVGGAVRPGEPHHRLRAVRWTELLPAEDFLLSRATLAVAGADHPAWLYIPDPATKPDHHQPADVVELLARPLAGLRYGAEVVLRYDPATLAISPAADGAPRTPRPR